MVIGQGFAGVGVGPAHKIRPTFLQDAKKSNRSNLRRRQQRA